MRFFENINDFPDELLLNIFKYLPVEFLPIAQRVCKKWLEILNLGDAKTFRKEQHDFFAILSKYKFTFKDLETKSTMILQSIYQTPDELIHAKLFDLKKTNQDLLNLMQEILSYYHLDNLNINLEDPDAFAANGLALKKFFKKTCSPEAINDLNIRVEQLPHINIRFFLKDMLSRTQYLEKIFQDYYFEPEKRDKRFITIANIKLLKDFCSFFEEKSLQAPDNEFTEIVHYQHRNYYVDEVNSHTNTIACICVLFCIGAVALGIYGTNELSSIKSVPELEKDGYTSSEATGEHLKQTLRDIGLIVTGFGLYCCAYFCLIFMDKCYRNKSSERIKDYSINYLKNIKSPEENRVEEILDETIPLNP